MTSSVLMDRSRGVSEAPRTTGGDGAAAAAAAARQRAIEAAQRRAEEARRLAEEARRAAEQLPTESRQQKAIKASQEANAAARALGQLTGQNQTLPFPDAESSDRYVSVSQLMDLGGPSSDTRAASPSSLLNEDFSDAQKNCLDLAVEHVQAHGLGAESSLVLLEDQRSGTDAEAGHVVVQEGPPDRRESTVYDPTTGRRYDDLEHYLEENTQYRAAGLLRADQAIEVASTTPGSAERARALDTAGVSPVLRKMWVADPGEGSISEAKASPVREREVPEGESGLRAQQIADRVLGPNATPAQRAKAYTLVNGLLGPGAATGGEASKQTPKPSSSMGDREPTPDQLRKLFQEQGLPINSSPYADKAIAEVDRVLAPDSTPTQRRQAYAIATKLAEEVGGVRVASEEGAAGVLNGAISGLNSAMNGKSGMTPSDFDRALTQRLKSEGLDAKVPPDAIPEELAAQWQSTSAGLPLSDDQRQKLDAIAAGERGEGAQRDLLELIGALEGAPPEAKGALLGKASESKELREKVKSLVASEGWRALSTEDQVRLGNVVKEVGADGLQYVGQLLEGGRLQDKDKDGRTLLDNLSELAKQDLNPVLVEPGKVTKEQLLTSVLQETADPSQVNQSVYGTCSQTAVQYALLTQNPSEYVRLMRGLSGTEGSAQMAGGDKLGIQHEYYRKKHLEGDTRSPSEVIFQGALMEYANGRETYDAAKDENSFKLPIVGSIDSGGGSKNDKTASQIFNSPYGLWVPVSKAEKQAQLDFLKAHPAVAGGDPLLFSFNGDDGSHAVNFVEVKDGRVYIRNPWGPGEFNAEEFGLKLEDSSTGLYSMSEKDFREHIKALTMSKGDHEDATRNLPVDPFRPLGT